MKNDYEVRGDVTAIYITRKGVQLETLIDTDDFSRVNLFPNTWTAHRVKNKLYVRSSMKINGKFKRVYMHRLIMDEPLGLTVDHKNNNTLDNRRIENLRILTNEHNQQNRSGSRSDNRTGVRNVEYRVKKDSYQVRLSINGVRQCFGSFKTLDEAGKVAKEAREKHYKFNVE